MIALLKNNQGVALVVVLALMVILLSIAGAGLLFSGLNLKTASSFNTGTAAVHVADVGIQHGLAVIPAGTDFDLLLAGSITGFPCSSPCNGTSNKPTLTGSLSAYSYSVVVENDTSVPGESATDDVNRIVTLTSTATGLNSSKRKIKAYIGRSSSWEPPGTIYAPGVAGSDFRTSGTFFITGDDTNYADANNDGRADSTSAGTQSPILGVAGGNQAIVDEFTNSLTSTEKSQVRGKNYNGSTSPATPSVGIPSTTLDVGQLANDLINQITSNACPPKCLNGLHWTPGDCPSSNPCRLGTDAAPQITYIKEGDDHHAHFDGYVYGSGILIVEGKAHLYRNFEFHGIVISLAPGGLGGDDESYKLKMKDDARIFGTLLLGPNGAQLQFDINNNAAVYYSKQGLDKATPIGSCCIPKPARLIAWHEVME